MAKNPYSLNSLGFKQGQEDGINGAVAVLTKVVDGTDKGVDALANRELEKIRRVFLMWRDHIIENMNNKNSVSAKVLLETKKIMDLKVPNTNRY